MMTIYLQVQLVQCLIKICCKGTIGIAAMIVPSNLYILTADYGDQIVLFLLATC